MEKSKNQILIWLFFVGILIGPAYNTYVHYDFSYTTIDCKAYMHVANAEFAEATITHRYRVIVPFVAKAISFPLQLIYTKLWPHRADSTWPLQLAFLIVNTSILAFAMLLLFNWLKQFVRKNWVALLACTALIAGRWYNDMAGLPLTDSLYVLMIVMVCIAIQKQNWQLTLLCIFLGPWSKESFLFVAPLLFWFGTNRIKQIPFWLLSGVLVFGFRYWIDSSISIAATQSIHEYSNHFYDIVYTFKKLASVRGIGEIFTVLGVFTFLVIGALSKKTLRAKVPKYVLWLFPIFILHAFLSGEAARMLAFATPLWGFCIALGMELLMEKFRILE